MPDVLDKLIDTLTSLDRGAIINAEVKDHERELIVMNTQDQLFNRGVNSEGAHILPDYAPSTIIKKGKKGLPADRVTLYDTGDWHKSFKIEYGKDFIEITAPPSMKKGWDLTQGLIKRYGELIFGLTPENLEKTRSILTPGIIKRIREQILLS